MANKETRKQLLKKHIEGLSFGLKNISLTKSKHDEYKNEEFKKLLNDNSDEIEEYLNGLQARFLSDLRASFSYYRDMNLITKSEIRGFKTYINGRVRFLNTKFIERISDSDSNATTISRFTIKFYLNYYNRINDIMHGIIKARFKEVLK